MATNDARGAKSAEKSAWSSAFEAVSGLAAAREAMMRNIDRDRHGVATRNPAERTGSAAGAAARATTQGIAPDQLARAVAEIEQASAALRRVEPTLAIGMPVATAGDKRKRYRSVWILIAGIWLSATMVVAGATAGILYVLR